MLRSHQHNKAVSSQDAGDPAAANKTASCSLGNRSSISSVPDAP